MIDISINIQTLPQLHCPFLDLLQHLSALLVVRGPKLNSVSESHLVLLFFADPMGINTAPGSVTIPWRLY